MRINVEDGNFSYTELQILLRALAEVIEEHFECNDIACNTVTLNRQMILTKIAQMVNDIESQDNWLDRLGESWDKYAKSQD